MTDVVALRYRNKDVDFEKSDHLVAVRARAGKAAAMKADIDAIAPGKNRTRRARYGNFEVIELTPSTGGIEQDLDWLRGRSSIAAASHVFHLPGQRTLFVPNGRIHLIFDRASKDHAQQAILSRYRLQAIETRRRGDLLVSVTAGSRNPIVTAAALQAEASVTFAEPEFAVAQWGPA